MCPPSAVPAGMLLLMGPSWLYSPGGTAQHGTARHGVAQHGMTQQSMAEIGIAWNRMAWHGRVWCGTECHSMMAQHSVTQHSMAWHDTAYRDVPCHSMTFHSVAQHAWPWGPCSPCTPASSSKAGMGPVPTVVQEDPREPRHRVPRARRCRCGGAGVVAQGCWGRSRSLGLHGGNLPSSLGSGSASCSTARHSTLSSAPPAPSHTLLLLQDPFSAPLLLAAPQVWGLAGTWGVPRDPSFALRCHPGCPSCTRPVWCWTSAGGSRAPVSVQSVGLAFAAGGDSSFGDAACCPVRHPGVFGDSLPKPWPLCSLARLGQGCEGVCDSLAVAQGKKQGPSQQTPLPTRRVGVSHAHHGSG